MENNLPAVIRKNTILKKMVNFMKNIFKKRKKAKKIPKEVECESKINELYKVADLEENNKKVVKEEIKKEKLFEIIQIIEKNPETLKKMDIHKLEVIDRYYKNEIEEYKKKIAKVS